jgi:hypothetical protein
VTNLYKHALRALVVACACALVLPLPAPAAPLAAAKTPCWKTLLNDWYDGRIDNVYPIPCYQDAINHLPQDIQVYSSARDDIQRALQLAVAHQKNPKAPLPTITTTGPGVPKTTTTKGSTKTTPTTASPGRTTPPGPIPSAISNSSPGGATSFPLPLIILGGLAIFLLAAGGVGLIIRRRQGRGGSPPPPGPA